MRRIPWKTDGTIRLRRLRIFYHILFSGGISIRYEKADKEREYGKKIKKRFKDPVGVKGFAGVLYRDRDIAAGTGNVSL